ncbi:MAG TPA: lipoate--protein ligase family protein [Longimicrobium sp.]|jgi:lipoate-protein ligase A|nr:lipoate--protein ligase family protein [Longimicrobium sp.]
MQPNEIGWRLVDTPPAPGAWNMAVDEALAASVAAGGAPVLRFYRWEPACLSLGRNQPARGRYDLAALAAAGIDVVRRPTGGRAVLHRRELTYSVAAPVALLGPPRPAYAAINRALVAGLRRLGAAVSLQPATAARAPLPSLAPCFAEPVEGEVVAGGRKLVGSAQRLLGSVILQHGSLPLHDDQSLVAALLVDSDPSADDAPPATLAEVLGREPAWDELTAALAAGWEESLGAVFTPAGLTGDEAALARAGAERYAGPAWTWHQ